MFSAAKTAAPSTGYNLTRSLRLRASASARLVRTFGTPTNQNKWTLSVWVKVSTIVSNTPTIIGADTSASTALDFTTNSTLEFGWSGGQLITTQVFRDPSAWYNIIVVADTTNATATNRLKIYINGAEVTAFGTDNRSSLGSGSLKINSAVVTHIGTNPAASRYYDGYMAEMYFVDGQALTPSSFGSTNTLTGVWQPARYTGTYGNNGFYLPFTDNSSLTTSSNIGLGKDFSGNGNYWQTDNISITAGVTYDSMTDVPTLTSETAANFCVLNPITRPAGAGTAFSTSGGNLNCAVAYVGPDSTIAMSTGKWYWEVIPTSGVSSNNPRIGIVPSNHGTFSGTGVGDPSGTYGYASTGQKATGGTYTSYGASFTDNDVIGVALDMTAGTIVFYKNGVSQGTAFTGLTGEFLASVGTGSSATMNLSFNFGQRPFAYTPPTGYVALNTYNLPTPTILAGNKYMDATLYTGTAATLSVTNTAGFKPDLVWIKNRSNSGNHGLVDSVRGRALSLYSDLTSAEGTSGSTQDLTSFNSNGFSLGTQYNFSCNASGNTYVGWQWQAGQGTTSSNTSGSITSTVSVNASAGFSVVTYTGVGAARTVGHGLGVAPSMIIGRSRTDSGFNWGVWHKSLQTLYGNDAWLRLNTTDSYNTSFDVFDPQNNTSSVFGIGTEATMNASGSNFVAYCFSQIAGYSSFGSYSGNGSTDGPMIYTGFQPRWVCVKRTDSTGNWDLYDGARNPYNTMDLELFPNSSSAEYNGGRYFDFLSNGFKPRTTVSDINASGGTYIYWAFATNPFKYALAR